MPETVYLNGRFLTQTLSGVQRYARELVTALDHLGEVEMVALVPDSAPITEPPDWNRIEIRPVGGGKGHFWEQRALWRASRDGVLVNLCGSGPLLHRRQFLVIHDANIWAIPEAFSRPYLAFHRTVRPILARRAARLGTVSRFSAEELAPKLGVKPEAFEVIYNSAEHITGVDPDPDTLERHGLTKGGYLLTIGNQSPNKNVARLAEAFARAEMDGLTLAVAGGGAAGVVRAEIAGSENVKLLGRVSDAELAALYRGARAFVWPSLYEGFGIPPLEAMTLGVPVVSSSTTAMPEILGEAAMFFDPVDAIDIARALEAFAALSDEDRAAMTEKGRAQAAQFSWEASARQLARIITDLQAM